eukprot:TRINITY_DN20303_c0_g1_i1.p1 TRINITY_DN20303_c0_g1~~TRINITY_DN20303_c0_g1_i1.p1  ORF type:complete len:273 (+),score=65.97 TRINITY_DN20303_c0_g1_i1:97-915(+)
MAQQGEIPSLYAFPWRICLAGGWLDQPWVSKVHPGGVIVVNIEPHEQFKERSGLATSSRKLGIRLWGTHKGGVPPDEPAEALARWLFNTENPVDCEYVSGSQDALGLMLPGINWLSYDGGYWPKSISSLRDESTARWLERVLWLVPLPSRPPGYNPLKEKHITQDNCRALAAASAEAWAAIEDKDAPRLGRALSATMAAWRQLLPETVPQPRSTGWVAPYADAPHLGHLFSGSGGGFLLVISEVETPALRANAFKVKVRTQPWRLDHGKARL